MPQNFKTIDQPFVIEIIDERFDNVSTMLTDNALIYGSSITSIMSGLAADGDLDIAVSHIEFITLCERFANSSKWKQISGDRIKETDFSNRHHEFRSSFRSSRAYKPSGTYKPSDRPSAKIALLTESGGQLTVAKKSDNYRNISRTVTFETVGNKCVQIIQAKEKTDNPLDDAMSIVKAVDFIFCGIAIDKHGKTSEVIESAFDDCHNKVIRVANYHSRLTERFNKYTKRGWSLGISIEQANQNYLKIKKEEKKREENLPTDDKYIRIEYSKKAGPKLIFLSTIFKKLRPVELHSLITSTSKQAYGVYLRQVSNRPLIYIENVKIKGGYHLTATIAKQLRERIIRITKEMLAGRKKKKFQTTGDYGEMTKFAKEQLGGFVSHKEDIYRNVGTYTTGSKLHVHEEIEIEEVAANISSGQHINPSDIDTAFFDTTLSKVEPDEEVDMPDEADGPEEVPIHEQSKIYTKQVQDSTIKYSGTDITNRIIDDTHDKYRKLSVAYGEWRPLGDKPSSPTAGAEWYSGLRKKEEAKKNKKIEEDRIHTIDKIIKEKY